MIRTVSGVGEPGTTTVAAGAAATAAADAGTATASASGSAAQPQKKKKLSYKDQRELQALPALIESLEQRQQALEATMAEPDFYQGEHSRVQDVIAQLAAVNEEMEAAFERWAELDG